MATTLGTVITLVRQRISDPQKASFPDTEITSYIADSLRLLTSALISQCDPELRRTATLGEGDSLPDGFVAWAGKYPIELSAGSAIHYIDSSITSMSVNYWYNPSVPAGINDNMPISDLYLSALVTGAAIGAFNRNEADVGQDSTLLASMMNAANAAKGKGS
jgi:hypothetical protein